MYSCKVRRSYQKNFCTQFVLTEANYTFSDVQVEHSGFRSECLLIQDTTTITINVTGSRPINLVVVVGIIN